MKKILMAAGAVIVGVCIVMAVVMFKGGGSPLNILGKLGAGKPAVSATLANYVPGDAVAYIGFYDLKGSWDSFIKTKFWKNITALQLWKDIDFDNSFKAFKTDFQTQTGFDLSEENIMELLGRQFAFVLFMKTPRQESPSAMIITQVGTKTKLLTGLSNLIQQNQPNVEKIDYNGQTVFHFKATQDNPMDLSYVVVKDIMALEVGMENKNINSVIDMVLNGPDKCLSKNATFVKVTDYNNGPHTQELYLNSKEIVSALDTVVLPEAFQDETVKNGIKSALNTIDAMGGSAKFEDGLYTKLIIVPNYDVQNDQLKKLWKAEPQKSKSFGFVPKNAILFSSSHSLDIPTIWAVWQEGMARQNADQANVILSTINTLETNLGLSLTKDIFPALSNEVAYMVSDVDVQGFIPIPKAAVFLKVNDAGAAKTMMDKLIAGINKNMASTQPEALPMLDTVKSAYGTDEIFSVKINQFPVPGLTPCYAVIEDQLIIASNTDTLSEVIDVYHGKKESLRNSPNYAKVKSVFTDKNNQISFINMELTVNKVVAVCNWLIDLQKSAGTVEAVNQDTITLISNNLIPFIQSFSSIKALAANTVYTNGSVEKIIIYKVEDF